MFSEEEPEEPGYDKILRPDKSKIHRIYIFVLNRLYSSFEFDNSIHYSSVILYKINF